MATNETVLTREGRAELERELAWREGEKKKEIVAALQEARGFGDFSENAELDAAQEEQSRNEARINEIRHILATARIVEAGEGRELSVSIGTTVEVEDDCGKKTSFTIVGTTETDSLSHRISNESPAGAAMIGHVVGDSVSYVTPTGKMRTYTILDISR